MRLPLARFVCALLLFASSLLAHAEPAVPTALEPWRAWVLKGQEFRACPLISGRAAANVNDFLCVWPGVLKLVADADGASFNQHWRVDADAWVPLPGSATHWPQQVTLDGKPAPVLDRSGPVVWLASGDHELRGHIPWRERPQSLRVPRLAGVVDLVIDGKHVQPLQQDGDELSLGRVRSATPEANSISLRVFRRLRDEVPAQLDTVIELRASGQIREEILGPALPAGFLPTALDSRWPARMDGDGRLHVRVQPGTDTLHLSARSTAPLVEAIARIGDKPWPAQEIWSYAADPRLRVTVASSMLQVDPNQSDVPEDWRELPAFALADGGKLAIEQRSRGLSEDEGNRLTLRREMWLDFDGGGWFVRDRLQGTMLRHWRLDAALPYTLERARALDGSGSGGDAMLVTRGAQPSLSGVEWRTPQVALDAGLRIDGAIMQLPVTGWTDSLDRIDTTLHLPNGYRLLGAPGADRAVGSWAANWTLLDIFLAAVLTLLTWRAFGHLGGGSMLAYLLLGYQEPGAPLWTLLAVCALALILRELPSGHLATAMQWLRRAMLVVLLLIALPFIANQLRYALHPQLESQATASGAGEFAEPASAPKDQELATQAMPASPPAPMAEAARSKLESIVVSGTRLASRPLDRYSESTVVQTGSGEASWQIGRHYFLSWSGPVLSNQSMRLVIAPPWLVRPLRFVLAGLLGWLIVLAVQGARRKTDFRGSATSAALLLAAGLGAASAPAQAQMQSYPPDSLLNQLHARLIEAPRCAPNCSALANAEVVARGEELVITLDAQAAERSALPLPFDERSLSLRSLRIDGVAEDAIARDGGTLLANVPRGVHRIELVLAVTGDKLALVFPLRPMRVRFKGEGWEAAGLADDRLQTETLTLARARSGNAEQARDETQRFAPYVRVARALLLASEWSVETTVHRLAPEQGGFTVAVPLLAGEHVISAGFKVDNGTLIAAFAENEGTVSWTSRLDKLPALNLTAPALDLRAEVWQVTAGLLWHVDFSGVPIVAAEGASDASARVFEFDPLPGETLKLEFTRPEPVQGATRAIDAVALNHELGQRASTSTLVLTLRASQGGEHAVTMPPGTELLGVSRDGEALNLRLRDGKLSLPIVPGSHRFEIRLRNTLALSTDATTPAIALGLPAANIDLTMALPQDRWLLATGGPQTGPAVLYWSELLVMLLLAFALSRLSFSPLKAWQWMLLGIGFSGYSWPALLLVAGWLFALDWRARKAPLRNVAAFNLAQIGLVVLSLIAVLTLFDSIRHGLLGTPDMHVVGNASTQHSLSWFADRSADALPIAHAWTLPLWSYQVAMLAWSLWLASALLKWLRKGFAAWTAGGYWRRTPKPVIDLPAEKLPPPPA